MDCGLGIVIKQKRVVVLFWMSVANHSVYRRLSTLTIHVVGIMISRVGSINIPSRVLCCSSAHTAGLLQTVFDDVHVVLTPEHAKITLADTPNDTFTAIIVDDTTWNEGDLLSYCARKVMCPARLVLSSTLIPDHCFGTGADAVASSVEELIHAYGVLVHDVCRDGDLLQRRYNREATLRQLAGGALTHRVQQIHSYSKRLQQQLDAMQAPYPHGSMVKIVHISDTHNFHRYVRLPEGDLLLHTGDIVGNYGGKYEMDLIQQFADFLNWIAHEACPMYERIVFLAGNHDTYLDPIKQPDRYEQSMEILNDFLSRHPNVSYLNNSSVLYRGLEIYGTPTTICRVESQKRNMLSNGFERTVSQRFQDWESIPECDILLTHLPPSGLGLSCVEDSCPMLTNAVYRESRKAPRLHAFGHIHSQFGVAEHDESTILSNGSQERILRVDLYGGGAPIVLDLAV